MLSATHLRKDKEMIVGNRWYCDCITDPNRDCVDVVEAADYDLLVTEHERTEAELSDYFREQSRIAQLEAALRKLCNEVAGLRPFEYEVRIAISNTNWECLMLRLREADAALTPATPPAQAASPFDSDDVPRGTSETKDECAARVLSDPKFAKEYVETPAEPETLGWCVSSKMGHMCRHEKNVDCRDWLPPSQMKTEGVK